MARIVFDLDGTLIDSAPDIRAGANQILQSEGRPLLSMADTHGYIGRGALVFIEEMCAARDIAPTEVPRLHKAFLELYENQVGLTRVYPGVPAALSALRDAGHILGLCTNKPIRPTRSVLAHLDLEQHFQTVWGGDSLPVRKPDPAPLQQAFAVLGEGTCLYVGDSETDAETARRADIPFLLFTEGYRKSAVAELPHFVAFGDYAGFPDLVAHTLADLSAATDKGP